MKRNALSLGAGALMDELRQGLLCLPSGNKVDILSRNIFSSALTHFSMCVPLYSF
jgi:hypothetical protein